MEASIQFPINHQPIFLNNCPNELTVFVITFRIVELFEIIHPVVLGIVLDVR